MHATLDKAQIEELDIYKYEKSILLLENQVMYYKSTQELVTIFIEYVLEENATNA